MIKVTFLYPNNEGSRFDMDYYRTAHLDLSRAKFGPALKGLAVDAGTAGINPGSKPPFQVCPRDLGHLLPKPGRAENAAGALMRLFVALESRCG